MVCIYGLDRRAIPFWDVARDRPGCGELTTWTLVVTPAREHPFFSDLELLACIWPLLTSNLWLYRDLGRVSYGLQCLLSVLTPRL